MGKKMINKLVSISISFVMIVLVIFQSSITKLTAWAYSAAYPTPALTGNQCDDIVAIAESQKGYAQYSGSSNIGTVYGAWYDSIKGTSFTYSAWCAMFVSWCANQAGIDQNILTYRSYVPDMVTDFKNRGQWHDRNYTPSRGDIIVVNSSGHVGIVTGVSGSTVYTIEGNKTSLGHKCGTDSYTIGSSYITGYGVPDYNGNYITDEPIAPYPRPSGSPYVEKGSKGLYVKWVQYTLSVQLGYNIGSAGVDGDFGAGTDSAVKAFQRDNGLEVDGQVGSETINKIVEKVLEKLNPPDPTPSGPIMSTGAGKTLPDGDYYIFSHLNPNYYLDIDGSALPAEKGTNVSMWTASTGTLPPECDVWTLKYLDNGFYKIMQKGTNLCLDVKGGSQLRGTNVQVWTEHSDTPEQWSISATDTGYKIQARCGSYCLDVSGGKIISGTNVQVWESNDSNAQRFGFIPYGASIGQTIEDGIYTIQSAANNDYCLDVQGRDSTVYQKETNVQLWNVDDCNDTFMVEYLGDGYYSICESVSGLALDIVDKGAGGYLNKNNNIQVFTNNKTRNQKWIIRDAGDGYYNIISAYSGYSIDLDGGVAEQRRNIRQHYYNTSNAQKWKFAAPIEKPQSSVLIADKTSLLAGEEISFTVESDTATNYVISVENGNEKVTSQDMPNGTLSLYFSDVGEYTAFVTVSNIMGSTDSEKIKFTITSNISLHVGEIYQLQLGSERLTYKSHNTNVATVTNDGVITAKKEGTTILSVVTADSDVIQYTLNIVKQSAEGDCNNDGIFDVADVVLLQKWLLAVPDTNIANWQAADLCKDGKLDVFDLVMMKRRLIYG